MAEKRNWFNMAAKAAQNGKKTAEIAIYGPIMDEKWSDEEVAPVDFAAELKALGDVEQIDLRINSPGGSVFAGFAIHNMLVRHPAKVVAHVDGLAASIASVIAMAGDEIHMPANALMMIHDPSGMVWGGASDMRKMADSLDKITEGIVASYQRHSGKTIEEIKALMAAETWMTGNDAVALGFATHAGKPVKVSNDWDLSQFRHPPVAAFSNQPREDQPMQHNVNNAVPSPTPPDPKAMTREMVEKDHPDWVAQWKEAGRKEELARQEGLNAIAVPGMESLMAAFRADGVTTPGQAALAILREQQKQGVNFLSSMRADAAAVNITASADTTTGAQDFVALVDAAVASGKYKTRAEATEAVARQNPKAYEIHRSGKKE
ncbi:MAG: Clp protease ClpP [Magnetococcales bacterium]|nr:Clp protease ClpP [Magnetococcales bacterium]